MARKLQNCWRIAPLVMLAIASVAVAGCAGGPNRHTAARTSCATTPTASCPPGNAGVDAGSVTGSVHGFGAVATAPEVMAAEARRDAAAEEIEKARASARPDAGFVASLGGATERNEAYSGQNSGGTYSYALSVDIPLYQGGRPQAAMEAARADLRATEHLTVDRRISTTYELALSLLRIRQQRELIATLDRQRSMLSSLRSELRAELAAGQASRVDVDDTDRQIARIDVLRETARLAIADASRSTDRLGVSGATQLPDISGLGLGESQQALIDLALRNNPRIGESSARVDAAAARITEAKGEMLPTVSARLQAIGEDSELPSVDRSHGGRAEVRLSMPFNLNGATSATVRQRSDEKRAALFDSDAARRGVAAAVRSAFERRLQARRMLTVSQTELRSAKSMLSGVRAERKVGERSTFDEIRAIENVTSAETNLNAAKYELQAAEYTLAAETGVIDRLFRNPAGPAAVAAR